MTKRISLIALGLAIILIPTFIMLSFYLSNRDIPVEIRTANRLTMTTPEGTTVTATQSGAHKELLPMLKDMTLDAKSVEKLPQELREEKPFVVTFYTESSSLVYKFYFAENPAYCYYVEPDGRPQRIATEKAIDFLSTDYAESVYSYAAAPIITVNGKEVSFSMLQWQYRRLDGIYKKAACSFNSAKVNPLDLGTTNTIDIECAPSPDSIEMHGIGKSGEELFKGTPEEFALFTVEEETEITLAVTVLWRNDNTGRTPFVGKATFELKTTLYPPAKFAVSKTEVRAGEVFILSGIHVTDPKNVQVSISPKVDFTPVFAFENGSVKALMTLGFPAGYHADSVYRITVSCPDMPEQMVFDLTVKGQIYPEFTDYIKKDVLDDVYTLKTKNEFASLVKDILAQSTTYDVQSGRIEFGQGVKTSDTSRHYAYGTSVTVFPTKEVYRALDTMYGIYGSSRPIAVANGTVCYVGESTLTGKLLVIDHGNGLRSWYCNLKDISVKVGDTLQKGDVIGSCGGGGFNGQAGINMHVALTLQEQALNLDIAIENGIEY